MVVNPSHIIPHLACLPVSPAPLDSSAPKSKEPRLKHCCSGPLRSILQTNWWETPRSVKDKETTTTSNNKNRIQEDIDGHIFYPSFSTTSPSADPGGSTTVQIGRREGVKGGNLLSHNLTAHVQALCSFLLVSSSVDALVKPLCTHILSLSICFGFCLHPRHFLFHHIPPRCLLSNSSLCCLVFTFHLTQPLIMALAAE